MDPQFQSSFIPKGPIVSAGSLGTPARRSQKSFFGFIAVLIFIIAILLSVALFAYKIYLDSSIGKMDSALSSATATLEPDTIHELANANARILSTKDIIAHHIVLSPLFDFLEASTLRTVRFTDFSYSVDDKGALVLSMKGQAQGYAAVSLESEALNKSSLLKNVVFSDLTLNDKGAVTFSLTANVDPALVSYQREIQGQGTTAPAGTSTAPAITTAVATTTATTTKATTSAAATTTKATTATSTAH